MEEVGLEIASFLLVFLCKQIRLQLITHVHFRSIKKPTTMCVEWVHHIHWISFAHVVT